MYVLFTPAYSQFNTKWLTNHNGIPPNVADNIEFHFIPGQALPQLSLAPNIDPPGIITNCFSENDTLLLYTNGIKIFNRNNEVMENGDSINYSTYWYFNSPFYTGFQSTCFIPFNDNNDKIVKVLHVGIDTTVMCLGDNGAPFYSRLALNLYMTTINMSANNTLGKVVSKSVSLIADSLSTNGITAVRHGNGRDWWVIVRKFWKPEYYLILIKKDTVIVNSVQMINGLPYSFYSSISSLSQGATLFSPDGNKFIQWETNKRLNYFEFNRCSGNLNYQFSHVFASFQAGDYATSACFSPNSRFLYLASGYYLYQLDTDAPNILNTVTIIDSIDFYFCNSTFPLIFAVMNLAPDGKIYISSNGCAIHVINDPDLVGVQCSLVQHQLFLPGSPNRSLANLPYHLNYSLGPLTGSPCDTLTGYHEQQIAQANITVSPNPGQGLFKIVTSSILLNNGPLKAEVFDLTGRKVLTQIISAEVSYLDLSAHSDGLFLIRLLSKGRLFSLKVVKQSLH